MEFANFGTTAVNAILAQPNTSFATLDAVRGQNSQFVPVYGDGLQQIRSDGGVIPGRTTQPPPAPAETSMPQAYMREIVLTVPVRLEIKKITRARAPQSVSTAVAKALQKGAEDRFIDALMRRLMRLRDDMTQKRRKVANRSRSVIELPAVPTVISNRQTTQEQRSVADNNKKNSVLLVKSSDHATWTPYVAKRGAFDIDQHNTGPEVVVFMASLSGGGEQPSSSKLHPILPLKKPRARKDTRASTSDWRSPSSAARKIEKREARLKAAIRHVARAADVAQNCEPQVYNRSSVAAVRDEHQDAALAMLFDSVQIDAERVPTTSFIEEVEVVDTDKQQQPVVGESLSVVVAQGSSGLSVPIQAPGAADVTPVTTANSTVGNTHVGSTATAQAVSAPADVDVGKAYPTGDKDDAMDIDEADEHPAGVSFQLRYAQVAAELFPEEHEVETVMQGLTGPPASVLLEEDELAEDKRIGKEAEENGVPAYKRLFDGTA